MNAIDTSIVMITWTPTPERLAVLKRSFASLKRHTQRPHQLVVVENDPGLQHEFLAEQDIDLLVSNRINVGVGPARNEGVGLTNTRYVAFVDNDIGYFPGWLNACIGALEAYPRRKLVATATWNQPMGYTKSDEALGGYGLYGRCAGMTMVMRRRDFTVLGPFSHKTNVGHCFCAAARKRGYQFIFHPTWNGQHLAYRSYHFKKHQFDPATGTWTRKESKQ